MDDVAPVLNGVRKKLVICHPLPQVANVTADDPAQPVNIEYSQSTEQGEGPGTFIVTRRWLQLTHVEIVRSHSTNHLDT